ncbi:MAG: hypothetical protein Q7S29_04480 [Candidatus Peribacter sp.]|nr:hypothetical protein [Candidatus Peribacter sp.]
MSIERPREKQNPDATGEGQRSKERIDSERLGFSWKLRLSCIGLGVRILRMASRSSQSLDPVQQKREILDRINTILSWVPQGMRDRLLGNKDAEELFALLEGREVDDARGIGDAVAMIQRREQMKASQPHVGRNAPCPCGAQRPEGTSVKFKHCCGNKK